MMLRKRLAVSVIVAVAVAVTLFVVSGAGAKENTKAVSNRGAERMAQIRISGLSDVEIDCAESVEPANTGYPRVKGDYPPFEITYADLVTPGTYAGNYNITRVWTVRDAYANEKVATQTIFVRDTEPPVITCPPDVTFECDAIGDLGEATAEDNSQVDPVITFEDSIIWQRCEHEYIKIRTWTATDQSGNSSSCEQTININDSTPPVIVCPNDTTVACEEIGNLPHAVAWDNCVEDLHMDYEAVRIDDDPKNANILLRTWEVTDGCCNKVGCYQRVTLTDTIPPVITCAKDDTISCREIPVFTDPFAEDNCEPKCEIEVMSSDQSTDPTTGVESFTRCWKAYDNFGNWATCCQTIVRLPCEDSTCTFTQGGWGNGCPGPQQGKPYSTQPGCIRDYYFGTVFGTGGVTIGIPAGSTHGATWTTAAAVEEFLPAGGTPGPLTGDLTDPTTTPAGVLAGQILALRLNREYSCAGIFNIALNPSASCLGPMMIPEDCQGKFGAMTVDDFLAIADDAIAGVPGALDAYEADFSDLNETATCLNEHFNYCGEDGDEDAEDVDETVLYMVDTPAEFGIKAVKPNPLQGSATIHYALPKEGRVSLEVYDIQGRKIRGLVDDHRSAGYHGVMWNGKDDAGESAAQGVYFLRMKFEDRPAVMHKLIKVE